MSLVIVRKGIVDSLCADSETISEQVLDLEATL